MNTIANWLEDKDSPRISTQSQQAMIDMQKSDLGGGKAKANWGNIPKGNVINAGLSLGGSGCQRLFIIEDGFPDSPHVHARHAPWRQIKTTLLTYHIDSHVACSDLSARK